MEMLADRIIVAAGAVIQRDDGRILLVKHLPEIDDYWKGKWICPGGKIEVGERIEEAILREVQEETHLRIELLKPILPFERIVKRDNKTLFHVVYIDYMARSVNGTAAPDSDVGEVLWVNSEELRIILDMLHEDTKRLLRLANLL